MTSVAEVQTLLRFLSQDAKVPVPLAMSKVKDLTEVSLTTPESLSKAPLSTIQSTFPDEKLAKQILSAAKRVSKKRTSSSAPTAPSPAKRTKCAPPEPGQQLSPAEFEISLALPTLEGPQPAIEDEINSTIVHTNRAPLVVAFVVQLLKHTMPSQPLSSRLSLAQAVMSIGAKSRALNLGIQSGRAAEDEGWGEGQPKTRVMGRELRVMRRWGYEWQHEPKMDHQRESIKQEDEDQEKPLRPEITATQTSDIESQETIKGDPSTPLPAYHQGSRSRPTTSKDTEPPLWGLNLETLRSTSNTSALLPSSNNTYAANLPVYDPHAARNYLLRSFATAPTSSSQQSQGKSRSAAKEKQEKEHNLALLLRALDMVYASWIDVIGAEELDHRAWGWYVRVRPAVESGPAGWGGRGDVRLKEVLELRR
ncbi:MAG: hypothetical protein LQ341_000472 [Variospora aurantia]|nr:MAG: hypothetical protein LQ341_000472 [Variospora aurantia]